MLFLTKSQILKINYLTIQYHGGNFNPPNNFLNESALEYLIEIEHSEMFGKSLYLSVFYKSGV